MVTDGAAATAVDAVASAVVVFAGTLLRRVSFVSDHSFHCLTILRNQSACLAALLNLDTVWNLLCTCERRLGFFRKLVNP